MSTGDDRRAADRRRGEDRPGEGGVAPEGRGVLREAPGLEAGLHDGLLGRGEPARDPRRRPGPRLREGPRVPGGVPLHAGRPADDVPGQGLDDPPVRRLRVGPPDERAVQGPPRPRPDGPLDGLPPPDALRLRLRPRDVGGRGGEVRRRRRHAPRLRGALRRDRPRRGHDVDDDQLDGADRPRDVPRRRREAGDPLVEGRRDAPERHPQGIHRAEGVHLPAAAVDAARDGPVLASARSTSRSGTPSPSPATTSARRARPRSRSSPSRSATGWST